MSNKEVGSRFATREEMENSFGVVKLNLKQKIDQGGLPIGCDGDDFYIDSENVHHLIIGSTGSGKTQVTVLPMINTLIESSDSFLVTDVQGEIYRQLGGHLQKKGYTIFILNFKDYRRGCHWNPLTIAEKYYRNGDFDKADLALNKVANYIYVPAVGSDPFWDQSAANYFVGLAYYLLENKNVNITLKQIFDLSLKIEKYNSLFPSFSKENSSSQLYLSTVLKAATETKKSIISVFEQKIKKYVVSDKMIEFMRVTDFQLEEIPEKVAIFLITPELSNTLEMQSLLVDQIYESWSYQQEEKEKRRLHFLLDGYGKTICLQNFDSILRMARGKNINFTILVERLQDLEYLAGKEIGDRIRDSFAIILYLLSSNQETLEEISKLCGKKEDGVPLIPIEQLRTLHPFQAVLLKSREYPFLTQLKPNYKIDWGYEPEEVEIPEHEVILEQPFVTSSLLKEEPEKVDIDELIKQIDEKLAELDEQEKADVQVKEDDNHKIVIEKTKVTIYPKEG